MTPKQLRDVAWALDKLSDLTRALLEPIAGMDPMNAETLDVTVHLTKDERPMTSEEAQAIIDWVEGDAMQRDLRALADELEAPTTYAAEVAGEAS